jgi:hypothetical protein
MRTDSNNYLRVCGALGPVAQHQHDLVDKFQQCRVEIRIGSVETELFLQEHHQVYGPKRINAAARHQGSSTLNDPSQR